MSSDVSIRDRLESRRVTRSAFLSQIGWSEAAWAPIGEDCAFRRYFRLSLSGRTAVLMESVPDGSAMATPGHRLSDFIRIGRHLREAGLHTPEIYEADAASGYLLLEDFGDNSFKAAIDAGVERETLYGAAVDILAQLREIGPTELPAYYDSHVHTGRRRIVDWYLPAVRGRVNPDGLAEEYLAVWDEIERGLPPCPQGLLHIDFHVENLMWLPRETGLARCGILDFQGAMHGPLPYDLANLLEDARLDIAPELRAAMLARYCAGMDAAAREGFERWYRVLATQFHCRVAGQFIRLAVRDGKGRYLQHLSRLGAYLRAGLAQPVLAPLRAWFAGQGLDFAATPEIDVEAVRKLVREDAF